MLLKSIKKSWLKGSFMPKYTRESIEDAVLSCISNIMGCDMSSVDLYGHTHMTEDIGMDSLDFAQMVNQLEFIYKIKIKGFKANSFMRTTNVVDYIAKKVL